MWPCTYAPRNENQRVTPASAVSGGHAFVTPTLANNPPVAEMPDFFDWQRSRRRFNVFVFDLGRSMKRVACHWTRARGSLTGRPLRRPVLLSFRRTRAVLAALAAFATWSAVDAAAIRAQERAGHASTKPGSGQLPNAVLFSTAGPKPTVGPLDSVISASLEKLEVVSVVARPGMDLSAVQLAIDCVGETPQCLRAVAKQTAAQTLIAPSVQTTQSELVLTILRFDVEDGQTRRALRRQPGTTLTSATLDSVPSMLRELFDVPEPAKQPAAGAAETKTSDTQLSEENTLPPIIEPPQEPEASRPVPVGPLLLAGGGVLVLTGGVVAGAMMASTNDEFNTKKVSTPADVSKLLDLEDKAKTQALVADVLFGVGGALVVAGGIWLAVALSQPAPNEDWQTAVVPAVAPGTLGLAIVHRGGAL
jgi:hypothetical protein